MGFSTGAATGKQEEQSGGYCNGQVRDESSLYWMAVVDMVRKLKFWKYFEATGGIICN